MAIKSKTLAALMLGALLATLPEIDTVPHRSAVAQSIAQFSLPETVPSGTAVKIDGDESMAVVSQSLKQAYQGQFDGTEVELTNNGTEAALGNLSAGAVDIAAIGRLLTDAEKAQGLVPVVLEREKIAVVVSEANAFDGDIGSKEFARLFRGEISDWSELGGAAGPIRFVDRPDSSDTRQSLSTYPQFQGAEFATGATADAIAEDNTAAMIERLGSDGVGYAIYSQVKDLPGIKVIPMHQVLPDNPAYPYSQPRVYVYKGEPNPAVQSFLGLATAPAGTEAVAAAAAAEAAAVAAGQDPTGAEAVGRLSAADLLESATAPEAAENAEGELDSGAETETETAESVESEGETDAIAAAEASGDNAEASPDTEAATGDEAVTGDEAATTESTANATAEGAAAVEGAAPTAAETEAAAPTTSEGEATLEPADADAVVADAEGGRGGFPIRGLLPLVALAAGGGLLWWLAAAKDDEDEAFIQGSGVSATGNLADGGISPASNGPSEEQGGKPDGGLLGAAGKAVAAGGAAAGAIATAGAAKASAATDAAGTGIKGAGATALGAVGGVTGTVGDMADKATKGAGNLADSAGAAAAGAVGGVTGAVGGVAGKAAEGAGNLADSAGAAAAGAVGGVTGAMGGVAGKVTEGAGNLAEKASTAATGTVGGVTGAVGGVAGKAAEGAGNLADKASTAATGTVGGVTGAVGGVAGKATEGAGNLASGVKDGAADLAGKVGLGAAGLAAGVGAAGLAAGAAASGATAAFTGRGSDAEADSAETEPTETEQAGSIESILTENRLFYPSEEFSRQAQVKSQDDYHQLYVKAKADPEGFWADLAETELHWFKTWDKTLEWDSPNAKWFSGGKLNITYNCLDRHLETERRNKPAILWEGEPGDARSLTYAQLHREVCLFANSLKKLGVGKGDVVGIYMPMVPEAAIAMLACARIGAPHSVVFGGFSAEALRDRLNDGKAKLVITADGGWRKDKIVELKPQVDKALADGACPSVENVLVVQRTRQPITMEGDRDHWWHDLRQTVSPQCKPEPMDSEDVLFILYTSGSTGKPKGVVHTTGGYNLYTHMTTKWIFDLREDDVYWCTADVGWITGHSYIVYGPLSNGATSLMYEGAPRPSNPGCFWDVVEKYKVSIFYTAPTAVRAFIKMGEDLPKARDLSSLRLLGTVGEPINPEAWMWYHRVIGGERCPIVDTWWQTETGGVMITSLPGAVPTKPGSAARPFPGIIADVVDKDGKPVENNQGGYLIVRHPWPSMIRGVYGDPERFRKTYFEQIPGQDVYFAGDGARIDEDGYFWVMGRVDDVISVSGHRLGTMEIESALVSHPAIAEAAVVGRPDDLKGEEVFAFVTLEGGQAASDELVKAIKAHVVEEIGALARPSEIKFTDSLPKTRSGKIMRRLLRKVASGEEISGDTSTLENREVLDQLRSGD